MSAIVVTGAAGFIGSHLCDALLKEGHVVLGLDDLSGGNKANLSEALTKQNFLFRQVDLRVKDQVELIISDFRPSILYHLAANAREGASWYQPVSIVERNTVGYINTLEPFIKYGGRKVILFSSMSVYGDQNPPFQEWMTPAPVDPYGLQKTNMELLTRMMAGCHHFDYVIIRPHNVFGPRQALNDIHRNVIGIWMNKIMREEPVTIYGAGYQERALSYIDDSLPAYVAAMEAESGNIFNIGGDEPRCILQLARMTVRAMGQPWGQYPVDYLPPRHGEVPLAYCSHELAKGDLNFVNRTTVSEGIKKMAEWALSRGPQEWRNYDKLTIPNSSTPEMWR